MNCFGDIQKVPTFCSDSFTGCTNRFAATYKKKEIVVTESANLVTKYDIGEQLKTVQSWSFDELNKLYLPLAIYYVKDKREEHFVGVHSCNTLIEWSLNESNELTKVFKKNFKTPIVAILSFPVFTKFEPLIIFSNGHAEFLEKVKSDYYIENNTSIIEKNEKIIGIDSHITSKTNISLYFVVDTRINRAVYKSIITTSNNESLVKTEKLILTEKIDVWSYCHSSGYFMGASKVSNMVKIFSLEPSIKNSKQMSPLYQFDEPSFDSICSLGTCSNGAICILGKKSSENSYSIEVYETHYSTKIGNLNLSEPILSKDFGIINDQIFMVSKNNLIVIPILNQKVLLSQLLTTNISKIENHDDNIKSKNNIDFKSYLGISDLPLTIKKIKSINQKFKKITSEKCDDIPEEILVFIFDFCTKTYLDLQKNENVEHIEDIQMQLKEFFHSLVKLPFNEVFLVSCLKSKNIDFEQYLLSIKLLLELIPCKECSTISWLSVLLDVNFSKFVIKPSQNAFDALNNIYDHIKKSIHFYEELGPVKTMLDSLIKREKSVLLAITNESTRLGQYSIEMLSFS